jgi:hypothetical protein
MDKKIKCNSSFFHILFYFKAIISVTSLLHVKQSGGIANKASTRICPSIHLKLSGNSNDYCTYSNSAKEYSLKRYNTKEKQYVKKFKKYGIFYKKSLLTDQEFNIVKEELSNLSLNLVQETMSSVAHNRIGAQLPPGCQIIKILSNPEGSFMKVINEVTVDADLNNEQNMKMVLSPVVPVEMRIYEERGAGMEWHQDDLLYEPEQIEVVFTVENNSDCVTMWEEAQKDANVHGQEIKLKQVETEPNSAIILRAGPSGARHSVSALKSGRRVILKFVFMRRDARFLEGAENHAKQFLSNKNKRQKKGKRKR